MANEQQYSNDMQTNTTWSNSDVPQPLPVSLGAHEHQYHQQHHQQQQQQATPPQRRDTPQLPWSADPSALMNVSGGASVGIVSGSSTPRTNTNSPAGSFFHHNNNHNHTHPATLSSSSRAATPSLSSAPTDSSTATAGLTTPHVLSRARSGTGNTSKIDEQHMDINTTANTTRDIPTDQPGMAHHPSHQQQQRQQQQQQQHVQATGPPMNAYRMAHMNAQAAARAAAAAASSSPRDGVANPRQQQQAQPSAHQQQQQQQQYQQQQYIQQQQQYQQQMFRPQMHSDYLMGHAQQSPSGTPHPFSFGGFTGIAHHHQQQQQYQHHDSMQQHGGLHHNSMAPSPLPYHVPSNSVADARAFTDTRSNDNNNNNEHIATSSSSASASASATRTSKTKSKPAAKANSRARSSKRRKPPASKTTSAARKATKKKTKQTITSKRSAIKNEHDVKPPPRQRHASSISAATVASAAAAAAVAAAGNQGATTTKTVIYRLMRDEYLKKSKSTGRQDAYHSSRAKPPTYASLEEALGSRNNINAARISLLRSRHLVNQALLPIRHFLSCEPAKFAINAITTACPLCDHAIALNKLGSHENWCKHLERHEEMGKQIAARFRALDKNCAVVPNVDVDLASNEVWFKVADRVDMAPLDQDPRQTQDGFVPLTTRINWQALMFNQMLAEGAMMPTSVLTQEVAVMGSFYFGLVNQRSPEKFGQYPQLQRFQKRLHATSGAAYDVYSGVGIKENKLGKNHTRGQPIQATQHILQQYHHYSLSHKSLQRSNRRSLATSSDDEGEAGDEGDDALDEQEDHDMNGGDDDVNRRGAGKLMIRGISGHTAAIAAAGTFTVAANTHMIKPAARRVAKRVKGGSKAAGGNQNKVVRRRRTSIKKSDENTHDSDADTNGRGSNSDATGGADDVSMYAAGAVSSLAGTMMMNASSAQQHPHQSQSQAAALQASLGGNAGVVLYPRELGTFVNQGLHYANNNSSIYSIGSGSGGGSGSATPRLAGGSDEVEHNVNLSNTHTPSVLHRSIALLSPGQGSLAASTPTSISDMAATLSRSTSRLIHNIGTTNVDEQSSDVSELNTIIATTSHNHSRSFASDLTNNEALWNPGHALNHVTNTTTNNGAARSSSTSSSESTSTTQQSAQIRTMEAGLTLPTTTTTTVGLPEPLHRKNRPVGITIDTQLPVSMAMYRGHGRGVAQETPPVGEIAKEVGVTSSATTLAKDGSMSTVVATSTPIPLLTTSTASAATTSTPSSSPSAGAAEVAGVTSGGKVGRDDRGGGAMAALLMDLKRSPSGGAPGTQQEEPEPVSVSTDAKSSNNNNNSCV